MLSASDIAELRDVTRQAMPSRMTLWRATLVEYPGGGSERTWAQLGADIACAISTNLSSTALVGDQARTDADAVVEFSGDEDFDVQPQDRVRIDEIDYEVQGYALPADRWAISNRMLVSRV